MASPVPYLARSIRASISYTQASSSTSHSSIRSFTSTAATTALKPVSAPRQKQKTNLRKKPTDAGPRVKRRGGSDPASQSSITLTNAFYRPMADMSFLPELTPEDANKNNLNKVMAWSRQDLVAFEKFGMETKVKNSLNSHIRPVSLVRSATLDLYTQLARSATASSGKRIALTGPLSGGKSYLMLQAVSYALASDWLVVFMPQLIKLINSSTAFEYSVQEQAYLQPDALQNIFNTILAVNSRTLTKIKINDGKDTSRFTFDKDVSISAKSTLADLLTLATTQKQLSSHASQQIFDLFLTSIGNQRTVPVLLAMDHLQALYLPTRYRTADYGVIQSYELAPIRSLIQFIAGKGLESGTILSAESHNNHSFSVPSEVKAIFAQQQGGEVDSADARSLKRAPLNQFELHAHARIHRPHLDHVKACNWSLVDVVGAWTEEELRALYELRRSEGRDWNGGNWTARQTMDMISFGSGSGGGAAAAATASEDELFMLRLLESGRNPHVFERSLWGGSTM